MIMAGRIRRWWLNRRPWFSGRQEKRHAEAAAKAKGDAAFYGGLSKSYAATNDKTGKEYFGLHGERSRAAAVEVAEKARRKRPLVKILAEGIRRKIRGRRTGPDAGKF